MINSLDWKPRHQLEYRGWRFELTGGDKDSMLVRFDTLGDNTINDIGNR